VNVLNVHRGPDTGGTGHRINEAFRRHAPDWTFRSVYAPNAFLYTDYPTEIPWSAETVRELWKEADVLHLHNNFATAKVFERMQKPKAAIIHYHGSAFRQSPKAHLAEQRRRGIQGIVSTLDLWLLAPDDLEWFPSPFDLEWLASLR
jgi:hypothetical protein